MGLNIQYVPHLAASLDPVADFLQTSIEGADLFQREYVIVPTAGVKAWLMPELARRFGARPGFSDRPGRPWPRLRNPHLGILSLNSEQGQRSAAALSRSVATPGPPLFHNPE